MSMFIKRLLGVMLFTIIISFVVALASSIIFVCDINGAKGLLPLIFLCLMLYFLLSFFYKVIQDSFSNNHKNISIKNADLILGIISALSFLLALFVYWL